jgi:hypothetical protein
MHTPVELADNHVPISSDDRDRLIQYVFSHRKTAVQDFLRERSLPIHGTKGEIRDRVEDQIDANEVSAEDLIALLDRVEGWGNQHVYMYDAPEGEMRVWKSEARAKARLKKMGHEELFNKRIPLVLPEEPTLSSVEWSSERVRFIWIEKREWTQRREDLDQEGSAVGVPSTISFKAYEDKIARGITSFDWNLLTGSATLLIQRLPSGERYDELRVNYESALEEAVHIGDFSRTKITKAIKKLEKSTEVRNRQIAHETQRGGRVQFTSKSRKEDAFEDPDLKSSRDALGQTSSVLGNFYWQEKLPHLSREIHTKLYATDQRTGIFGECTEEEVQYVLSRIRHFSR